MFNSTTALCRPSVDEKALITQTPGISWTSNVPEGEDCCTYVSPPVYIKFKGTGDPIAFYINGTDIDGNLPMVRFFGLPFSSR